MTEPHIHLPPTAKEALLGWAAHTVKLARVLCLEDARTEALSEIFELLDRVEPGEGTRVFLALYPGADKLLSGGELGRRA